MNRILLTTHRFHLIRYAGWSMVVLVIMLNLRLLFVAVYAGNSWGILGRTNSGTLLSVNLMAVAFLLCIGFMCLRTSFDMGSLLHGTTLLFLLSITVYRAWNVLLSNGYVPVIFSFFLVPVSFIYGLRLLPYYGKYRRRAFASQPGSKERPADTLAALTMPLRKNYLKQVFLLYVAASVLVVSLVPLFWIMPALGFRGISLSMRFASFSLLFLGGSYPVVESLIINKSNRKVVWVLYGLVLAYMLTTYGLSLYWSVIDNPQSWQRTHGWMPELNWLFPMMGVFFIIHTYSPFTASWSRRLVLIVTVPPIVLTGGYLAQSYRGLDHVPFFVFNIHLYRILFPICVSLFLVYLQVHLQQMVRLHIITHREGAS